MDLILASQAYQRYPKSKMMSKKLRTEDVDRFLLRVCGEPPEAALFRKSPVNVHRSRNLMKMQSISVTAGNEVPSKLSPGLLKDSCVTDVSEPDDSNYCIVQSSQIKSESESCASEMTSCISVHNAVLGMHLPPQCVLEANSSDNGSFMEWLLLDELKFDDEELETETFLDAQLVTQVDKQAITQKRSDAHETQTMEDEDEFLVL